MDSPNRNFRQELIKIIVDRLLIGAIIVILGLMANIFLEKHKARETFYSELNRIRVQKIGETWEGVYSLADKWGEYEKILGENYSKRVNLLENVLARRTDFPDSEYAKRVQQIKDNTKNALSALGPLPIDEINRLINKNKFWLGQQYYADIQRYIDAIKNLQHAETNYDKDIKESKRTVEEWTKKVREVEVNINSIRDKVFAGE